ncbi:MAG: translation initiation factor IF-3 [Patescibacteria group bacterium]|nr:translation initiation factor IF-3 [Patescibacteria group bacterium]
MRKPYIHNRIKRKRIFINNQIRAEKVRLIDAKGENIGILDLNEAIEKAKQENLDLIQITEKTDPPICKIMNYGKYLYIKEKKEKTGNKAKIELKGIRLKFNISSHDLETRAKQAEKFLKKGNKIRIEMKLRGREKALFDFSKEKIKNFLEILNKIIPIKIEQDLKRQPRGLTMIISRNTQNTQKKDEN